MFVPCTTTTPPFSTTATTRVGSSCSSRKPPTVCWRGRTSSGACLWRRFDATAGPCWLTESTPLTSTQLFARRLVRHIVTAIRPVGGDTSSLHVTANFVVLETLVDEQTKVHSAGAYRDRIVRHGRRSPLRREGGRLRRPARADVAHRPPLSPHDHHLRPGRRRSRPRTAPSRRAIDLRGWLRWLTPSGSRRPRSLRPSTSTVRRQPYGALSSARVRAPRRRSRRRRRRGVRGTRCTPSAASMSGSGSWARKRGPTPRAERCRCSCSGTPRAALCVPSSKPSLLVSCGLRRPVPSLPTSSRLPGRRCWR